VSVKRAGAAALAVALLLAPAAGTARAAGAAATAAPAPPPSPAAVAAAWFARGSVHHKVGEYATAIDCFVHAYKADPDPIYLYNIGLSYQLWGKAREAIHYYEQYLADDPDSPLRAEVEARLATLRGFAALAPESAPAGPTGPPSSAPALAPGTGPAATPPRVARRSPALALGIGLGAGAAVVAGAVVAALLFATDAARGRLLEDYPGVVVNFRTGP